MSLYQALDFIDNSPKRESVFNVDEIPKELDIFFRQLSVFLPEGKTLEDLTPIELAKIKAQYRFDALRPGLYQQITGIGNAFG